MAVVQCKECQREVDTHLISCPQCGTPVGYKGGTPVKYEAAETQEPVSRTFIASPGNEGTATRYVPTTPVYALDLKAILIGGIFGGFVAGLLGWFIGYMTGESDSMTNIIAGNLPPLFLAGMVGGFASSEYEGRELRYGLGSGIIAAALSVPISMAIGMSLGPIWIAIILVGGLVLGGLGGALAHFLRS